VYRVDGKLMTRIYETDLLDEFERNERRKRNKLTRTYDRRPSISTYHQREKQLTVKDNKKYQRITNNIGRNREKYEIRNKKKVRVKEKEKKRNIYFDLKRYKMCGDKDFVTIFNSKILAKLSRRDELEKLHSKLICDDSDAENFTSCIYFNGITLLFVFSFPFLSCKEYLGHSSEFTNCVTKAE